MRSRPAPGQLDRLCGPKAYFLGHRRSGGLIVPRLTCISAMAHLRGTRSAGQIGGVSVEGSDNATRSGGGGRDLRPGLFAGRLTVSGIDKIGGRVASTLGLLLLALAYAIGPIADCHVNPAGTLGACPAAG